MNSSEQGSATQGELSLADEAGAAYEAIRHINHRTAGATLAAPEVYEILGELTATARALPQALNQIVGALERSLDAYDVYDDDGTDPTVTVTITTVHLERAASLAAELGTALDHARNAIRGQGHR